VARDIAAVATLFQKSFRAAGASPPESLRRYFEGVFLQHPWADPELPSRVHVNAEGAVNGFIGVLPARMRFRDRPLRAAMACSLMVDDPHRDPLAGARLLRAFFKGPQELSFSETANPVSQGMWERLGGVSAPAYSMEWVKVFRPFQAAVAAVPGTRFAQPVAWTFDKLSRPVTRRFLDAETSVVPRGEDADDESLIAILSELAGTCPLRPDWTAESLRWLLSHARDKERHGPAARRIVHGRGGKPIGCYIYYGRPNGIAWVLQVLAPPDSVAAVVDDLFAHAARQGCAAVRGRTHPALLDALLRRKCLMLHRASTMLNVRDPELLRAVRAGEALLNGLAGEAWNRLIGGDFT
jgi:hypothetical protein